MWCMHGCDDQMGYILITFLIYMDLVSTRVGFFEGTINVWDISVNIHILTYRGYTTIMGY